MEPDSQKAMSSDLCWFDPALEQWVCTEILYVTLLNSSHKAFHWLFFQFTVMVWAKQNNSSSQ